MNPLTNNERAPKHTCDYHRDHLGRCAMCLTDEAERLFDELEARRAAYHFNSGMYRAMTALLDKAHARVLRRIRLQGIAGPREAVRCTNCGGAHHIQRCGEVWAALRAPDEHHVAAGHAIGRQWHRDRARFLTVLANLDRDVWPVLATAYCAWMNRGGCGIAPEHILRVWQKAVESDIALPPRAHLWLVEADASAESYAGMTKARS